MPPVLSPPLMPLSANFHSFPEVIPSYSSRARSVSSSESDTWSRHSAAMTHQPRIYGQSTEPPLIYQQSPKRAFPPARELTPRDSLVTTGPQKQGPDLDFHPLNTDNAVSMDNYGHFSYSSGLTAFSPVGPSPFAASYYPGHGYSARMTSESLGRDYDMMKPMETTECLVESSSRRAADKFRSGSRYRSQRRPSNRDEFDGPHQLLDMPSPRTIAAQEKDLPHLPTNLDVSEQDQILNAVNDRLSQCAFDFVAKYQFPIPLEPDKRQVRIPSDREWTEWVHLLKRLATKRRIPARVLYNGQIKQLVTILENSLEMRHAAKHQSRPIKDDRNVLQLISAGTQVAKILKDASAMEFLDRVYVQTEKRIQERRNRRVKFALP